MKKYFAFVALAALALAFTDCKKDEPVKVTGVSVSPTTLTLDAGAKQTLTATVSPADAENKNVTWKSSSDAVATVSATGEVTAVGAGTATITVTTVDGAKTATCAVTVNAVVVPPVVTITGDGFDISKELEIKTSESTTTPLKIDIEAPEGVATFMVEISSSSEAFTANLAAMNLGSFDIANPGAELGAVLTGLGLINGDAVKGKTELTFDITSFVPMMFAVIEAAGGSDQTAAFKLTVTDAKGTKAEKTVQLSLVDDTPAE